MTSLIRRSLVGIVAAVGLVAITFLIADAVSGPLLTTQPGGDGAQEVPLVMAVIATVIGGVVGTVLAFFTSRRSRPASTFSAICIVGLVLYGLFAWVAAESQSTGVWLNVMHLAAAVPIVGQLTRWLTERPVPEVESESVGVDGESG